MRIKKNKWNSVNSKGISPLLGFVLIIGLAIMLAALVYQFTFSYSETTIKGIEEDIESAEIINFNIKDVKIIDYKQVKFLVESEHNKEIIGFRARVYGEKGVKSFLLSGVKPFETVLLVTNYKYSEIGKVTKVDLIPTTEKLEKTYTHPISTETTIKINEEVSEECKLDINLNEIPDCVDDFDSDGCTKDIDYDDNLACNMNSCNSESDGCDNNCKPITCNEQELCVSGQCVAKDLECKLLRAYWSSNEVIEGKDVYITVEGENCEGKRGNITYQEIDTFTLDDDIDAKELGLPEEILLDINGTGNVTWKAKWIMDKDGNGPNPELKFIVTINPSIESENSLIVNPSGGVSGELTLLNVDLVRPIDNAVLLPGNVEFRCDISDQVDIHNTSLYTNISGPFKKENFVNPHEFMPDNDTIALYHLNNDSFYQENPTKFVDFSIYSNNGSCSGIPTGCPSRINGLFSSPAADYAQAGPPGDSIQVLDKSHLGNMNNLSISAWIYPRTGGLGGLASIVNKPNAFVLRIDEANGGRVNFRVYNDIGGSAQVYSSPSTIPFNTWTHVVVIYNGTTIYTYINGIEDSLKVQFSGKVKDSIDNLYIGNNNLGSLTFDGLIEEVILFNRTLSSSEVQDLYQRKDPILSYSLNKTINNVNNGIYKWNCLAYGAGGNSWHISNYSFSIDSTTPSIIWEYPTPENNSVVIADSVYLNTTIVDESNTSALFDWNNTLAAYWSFDYLNESGIYDNSSYNNFGRFMQLLNPSNINSGIYGKSLQIDKKGYLLVGNNPSLTEIKDELTIMGWINSKQLTPYQYMLSNDRDVCCGYRGYSLRISNGILKLRLVAADRIHELSSYNSIPVNSWHHIAGTFNTTHMQIYIDGNLESFEYFPRTYILTPPSFDLVLGALGFLPFGTVYQLNGSLDEVVVMSRALSSKEIKAAYDSSINRLSNNFNDLAEGQYNYSAYAIDEAGNLNISKRIVSILRIPSVNLSTPMNNAIITRPSIPLEFQCSASSANYLENISLYSDTGGVWNVTKSTIINELSMENGAIFLLHFNDNNVSEENESPLYEFGTSYVDGRYKKGIRIDTGDNLYYNTSNNFNLSYGTIEFWIKPYWYGNDQQDYIFFFSRDDNSGDHIKIGKTYNVWNYIHATFNNSAYEANSYAYGGGPEGIGNWAAGSWHHIAVTYNLSNHSINLYLDGNLRGYANESTCYPPQCDWTLIPSHTGNNFTIGHNYFFNPKYANAAFDEVIIYDRILNLSEIQLDMNKTNPTRSYNATFKVANISSGGPYKWNCLVYDNYNRSAWYFENWTFTYTATPYVELIYPSNNTKLNEGRVNFSCLAEDYDRLNNVTLNIYYKHNNSQINIPKYVGEVGDNDNGLVLLYHLNNYPIYGENESRVFDFSSNENNGEIIGPIYNETGRLSMGLKFNGSSDYLRVINSQNIKNINSSGTLSAWIMLDSDNCLNQFSGICTIFDIGGTGSEGLVMMINNANRPYLQYGIGTGVTEAIANPITKGIWYHIVGTWGSNGGKIYINGVQQGITNIPPLYTINQLFTYIGSNAGTNRYFNGTIDEISIFNRALDENEIVNYYNITKKRYEAKFGFNLEGSSYEWNCNAYDSDGYNSYSAFNNTLIINARPNITSIFIGNDGVMYDCKDGCYITPYRHSNVTNLNIRVSLIDNSCSLQTHKVFVHLCLINTTNNEICNEISSNYTYELNNLTMGTYESAQNKYLCNFSTPNELGPQGTPAFFVDPDNYKLFVNVTKIGTSLNSSLSNNYWVYRSLIDTGFIDSNGIEIDTIQLGDGNIQLGELNPGINEYRLQNWGNVILGVSWNATNPNSTISEWDINNPSDGFIVDDDININYPDIGLSALNITSIPRSFVFGNGLMRCINHQCNNNINESLSTRWHIKPPFGLPPGIYRNEITYLISPWKSMVSKQFSIDDQPSVDTSITALDNRTIIIAWVGGDEESVNKDVSFIIYDTNGTNLTSTIDVDPTVDGNSRVSVAARNSTHFVIAWYDGLEQDITYSIYNRTGQINYGPIDLETIVGSSFSDIALAQMFDRFHVCYVDVEESDADDRIVTYSNLGIGTEVTLGSLISPEASLQNLIGCSAINNTRLAYAWFDDSENDITYATITQTGSIVSLPTDLDTEVFEFGQVSATSFNASSPNYSRSAISWFDSSNGEITLAIKDVNNNNVLLPSLVGYSTFTRLAMTSIRNSADKTEDFILAWQDRLSDDIKAAAFNENGTIKYGPYILAEDEHPTNLLFDIYSRDSTGNIGICDDSFIFAYTNMTGQTLVKEFKKDGSGWDGEC